MVMTADHSSSHDILVAVTHDGHAWAIGLIAGGISALDPTIVGFGYKLASAAAIALITGSFYAIGGMITKKVTSFFKKKE